MVFLIVDRTPVLTGPSAFQLLGGCWLSFRFLEQPGIHLGDFLWSRRVARDASQR